MIREVGVFNAPPLYVAGLAASDVTGFSYETVIEPKSWIVQRRHAPLLVGVRLSEDLDLIIDLKTDAPDSVLVTVVDEYDVRTLQESLAAGAAGAVSRYATASDVALALEAALADSTVMPTDLVRRITEDTTRREPCALDDRELSWLQRLAQRSTVAGLGKSAGYSEREMYRRLRAIYRKMGVRGRTEALVKATRLGWIR